MTRRHALYLALILLLAAFLRFWGLAWGLPDARHWFSYHPDEIVVLGAAQRVNLFAGRWNPGFFNYGSFLTYCVSAVTQVVDAYAPLHTVPHEMARMTLIGRGIVAAFGVATVYVVYLLGRRLAGERAGLLSAATLGLMPMHAVHSHFVTVDIPATFWVSVALYNALRWPDNGRKALLWTGIAAGLAAGTKYNAGLVLLAGWAAVYLARERPIRTRWLAALAMTAAALAAFLASTPGVLLDYAAFARDFGFETVHVRTGHGLVFVNTGPGWWYHLNVNLNQGLGFILSMVVVVSVIVVVFPQFFTKQPFDVYRQRLLPLLAFTFPYFVLISCAAVRFQRYDLPMMPVLAAIVGLADSWLQKARGVSTIAGFVALAALYTFMAVETMGTPVGTMDPGGHRYDGDPRDAVADWFSANVPARATVGLTRSPWFFSPPFSIANAGPQSQQMFAEHQPQDRYRIITLPDGQSAFPQWPDYVVMSDYEYGDPLRLANGTVPFQPDEIGIAPVRHPDAPLEAIRLTRFWNAVNQRYSLVGMWIPKTLGVPAARRALPPHDAHYAFPTLIVWKRK